MAQKGFIEVDIECCKGCALCVEACPPKIKAIELRKKTNSKGYYPAQQINDLCIGCTACALVCPDSCITVYKLKK
ncbi:MAG: 4Fe-4S dicluster domain-containing protein [Candidatus Delongbacteria bacterium]|nr:4Fe-4S dicluster domain-containing protein [Candidatus Delongbacteria bacterium]MBN2833591.1 4Fe-4S dicluster domain-containing protein [Candidatus Delongbacteria bacterium]